jgi:hypothetical protein
MKTIPVDQTNTTPEYRKGLIRLFYKNNRLATKKQGVEFLSENYPNIKPGGHRGMIQRIYPKGEAPWDVISKRCPCCKETVVGLEACLKKFCVRVEGSQLQSWCNDCRTKATKAKKKKNGATS